MGDSMKSGGGDAGIPDDALSTGRQQPEGPSYGQKLAAELGDIQPPKVPAQAPGTVPVGVQPYQFQIPQVAVMNPDDFMKNFPSLTAAQRRMNG